MTIQASSGVGSGGSEQPGDQAPLCSEEEFAQEVRELVAEEAPRLFALVEEYGERVDGWIVAWGLAFEDRTEIIGESGLHMRVDSPERAQRTFFRRRTIRLVWTDPAHQLSASSRPPAPCWWC